MNDFDIALPGSALSYDGPEIVQEGIRAYENDFSLWAKDTALAKQDVEFKYGDQWGEDGIYRRSKKLPTLQIDQIDQYINRIVNEFRRNPREPKVYPTDIYGSVPTAAKLQGYIRHVQNRSRAKMVYAHALKQAVTSGMGWFRIYDEWIDGESFERDICIKRVLNRFSVVPGYAEMPDYSDMKRCFITETMSRTEAEEAYPGKFITDYPLGDDTSMKRWFFDQQVMLAEYWKVKETEDVLRLLNNGYKIFASVATEKELRSKGLRIMKSRETMRREVQWYKMSGTDVLEARRWRGRYIPLIPMIGSENVLSDGEIIRHGIVRPAMDPQRMYNFWSSVETQLLAKQAKRKVIAGEGQLEGHEHKWQDDNEDVLTYNPKTLGGQLLPAPRFEEFAGIPSGVVNAKLACRDDIKASLGIYGDFVGNSGSGASGIAIARKTQETENTIFHYLDNADVAIEHGCRVTLDLARAILDGPTMRRVVGEDGQENLTLFNEPFEGVDGKQVLFDTSIGEYAVIIDSGPSYMSKRQETVQLILELAKYVPEVLKIGGDILVTNTDGNKMDVLGRRFRKFIAASNPGLLDEEVEGGDPATKVAQLQGQLAQATQTVQNLQQGLQQVTEELVKATDTRLDKENDNNTKLEIANLQERTKIRLKEMELAGAANEQIEAEAQEMTDELEQLETQLGINREKISPEAKPGEMPANPGEPLPPAQEGAENESNIA
jgi:hypothetical protein